MEPGSPRVPCGRAGAGPAPQLLAQRSERGGSGRWARRHGNGWATARREGQKAAGTRHEEAQQAGTDGPPPAVTPGTAS